MSYIQEPTNSAGLLTLFEHRPFFFCSKHPQENHNLNHWKGYPPICYSCAAETEYAHIQRQKEQRIYEIRQAVHEYFEAARQVEL